MNIPALQSPRELHENAVFNTAFLRLQGLKAAKKEEEFNRQLLELLPETRRYIIRGLRLALSKGVLPHNKYRPEDFFDELFLDAYEHFNEHKNAIAFKIWLFERADTLLRNMEVLEISDTYRFENLETFTQAERFEMEESYTTNEGGDRIMMDELDDISYRDHKFMLKQIFLDDSHVDFMAQLDEKDLIKHLSDQLENVLFELPANQRSVFELAVEEGFEIEAIARIKNIQPNQVESLLIQAKNKLYEILSKRIFTTKNPCYEN
ncbi:MAG: hypothetical protein RLZZ241_980 [Bacteroidota bacterium]